MAPKTKDRNSCCGYGAPPARYADAKSQPLGLVSWDIEKLGPGWPALNTWHHMAPSNSYLSHHGGVGSLALCGERRSRLKWGQVSTCPHHRHSHHASSTQKQHASVGWAALVESQQRQQQIAIFLKSTFIYMGWHIYESDSPQICHVQRQHTSTHLNTPQHNVKHCETLWNADGTSAPKPNQRWDIPSWDGQVAFPKQPGPQVTNSWTSHGRHGNSRMARWYCCVMMCNDV